MVRGMRSRYWWGEGEWRDSTMERALSGKRPKWPWRLGSGEFHLPYTRLQLSRPGSRRDWV